MASRPTPSSRSSTTCPEIASLFKEEPVFSSDVYGDASGVLLAEVAAGSYVLMCRTSDLGVP
jgi:hypothetical protein